MCLREAHTKVLARELMWLVQHFSILFAALQPASSYTTPVSLLETMLLIALSKAILLETG